MTDSYHFGKLFFPSSMFRCLQWMHLSYVSSKENENDTTSGVCLLKCFLQLSVSAQREIMLILT